MSAPRRAPTGPTRHAPTGPTCRPHALGGIVVEIPGVHLVSEANQRGHTIAKAGRVRTQRTAVLQTLRTIAGDVPALPCRVAITRVSPGQGLDTDNLVGSAKACRDGVAEWLGIDDGSDVVEWFVCEERGPWAVRVEVVPVRAWSTAAASSRVVQTGAVTELDATLDAVTLQGLRDRIDALLAGERRDMVLRVGAVRLRLHAQRGDR